MLQRIKTLIVICVFLSYAFLSACGISSDHKDVIKDYGVFLSVSENLDYLSEYETVVIDAQYFESDEIEKFKNEGHEVFSYINVGALEDFRDYYDDYCDLGLGKYEHWDEEIWMDVSDKRWQIFILEKLAPELMDKGIDGFFVDNCDVYYQYPTEDALNGLGTIMEGLVDTGLKVIINGGDVFLDTYCESGDWNDVITGINQEAVFSRITWEDNIFEKASKEEREYFCDYVERYGEQGADIYLLEYTTDEKVIRQIEDYCNENGFYYYVSDSVELD